MRFGELGDIDLAGGDGELVLFAGSCRFQRGYAGHARYTLDVDFDANLARGGDVGEITHQSIRHVDRGRRPELSQRPGGFDSWDRMRKARAVVFPWLLTRQPRAHG